jgi:hypothetical protein
MRTVVWALLVAVFLSAASGVRAQTIHECMDAISEATERSARAFPNNSPEARATKELLQATTAAAKELYWSPQRRDVVAKYMAMARTYKDAVQQLQQEVRAGKKRPDTLRGAEAGTDAFAAGIEATEMCGLSRR